MKLRELLSELDQFESGESPNLNSLMELVGNYIPDHPYPQETGSGIIERITPPSGKVSVLDLGCGKGGTRTIFTGANPDVEWFGIDIAESNHLKAGALLPEGVTIYNGVDIPFEDGKFDIVHSHQVFEHVRHPEPLLRDVARVMKPGGTFFGSLSGLEPYHFHSLFNYTPYGWCAVLKDNGFEPVQLTAGIDGLSLMLHHYTKSRDKLGKPFTSSEMSRVFEMRVHSDPAGQKLDNLKRVLFAGHMYFVARKTGPAAADEASPGSRKSLRFW